MKKFVLPDCIRQTPNILLYLCVFPRESSQLLICYSSGPTLKLAGATALDGIAVNQLTLAALDLNNEIHDTVRLFSTSCLTWYIELEP